MRLCNSSSFTSIAAIAAKSSAVSVTHNLLVHSEFLQFNFCCRANSSSSCFPLPEQRRRREANRRRWSSLRFASRIRCSLGRESSATQTQQLVPSDFIVVNFYRFVFIDDPQLEVSRHLHFVKDLDLHGRIYLNEQGINAQYSGPTKDALAYVEWLRNDSRFSDLLVQTSSAFSGHAFPKLRLRYKPSLVQMEGGSSHLPLLDPSMRAEPLTPSEWRQRLEATSDRNHVLLDVRNGYEWDVGHFQGSQRPDVDSFRNCSFGLSDNEVAASDPLANVDKEKTDVLMYCTGGIRCDVYSTILRQQGFRNLYTLKGGVSHYLEREGPAGWNGNLFVFDDRLSLPPSAYNPETTLATENPHQTHHQNANPFARCYVCESEVSELRHRNCANPDCNFLFLCCESCVDNLRGCCCEKCTTGPRLRPVLPGAQRYMKWHVYRDSGPESLVVIESDKKKPIACPQA
ncbi:Rhodanese-like domain-containing protein 8, chloroplastic [Linum grandiflorum]